MHVNLVGRFTPGRTLSSGRMTFAIEIKFSWTTLQDESSDDSPGLLRTPRIAEGILPSCTAEIAFCLILSPTPCPSLQPPHSPGVASPRRRIERDPYDAREHQDCRDQIRQQGFHFGNTWAWHPAGYLVSRNHGVRIYTY